MNIAKYYETHPEQQKMIHAGFNPNIHQMYYPFVPTDEEFRRIHDYFPEIRDYFWVSNYGRVYNANNGYLVMPSVNFAGYHIYSLKRTDEAVAQGKHVGISIAGQILVCTCFNGPKPGPKHQANHKDFNRRNNYYGNLEWLTPQENLDYSRTAGNYWNGNVYSSAVYTEEQVRAICELLQAGITDPAEVSRRVFNIEPTPGICSLIRQIKSGKNWSQVSKDYSFADVEHRNFTPDYIIHGMCNFMQNNPTRAFTADTGEVLLSFGINPTTISPEEYRRYTSALHQLRFKGAYKRIAKNYNLPVYGGNSFDKRTRKLMSLQQQLQNE